MRGAQGSVASRWSADARPSHPRSAAMIFPAVRCLAVQLAELLSNLAKAVFDPVSARAPLHAGARSQVECAAQAGLRRSGAMPMTLSHPIDERSPDRSLMHSQSGPKGDVS